MIIQTPNKELNTTLTQSRRNNSVFKSQFLNNSPQLQPSPEIIHTFFRDRPFDRFKQDKIRYRPVSHQSPYRFKNRTYIVVDQQVKEGQPLTAEQFNSLMSKKLIKTEVITYGSGVSLKDNVRVALDVKKESKQQKSGWCCCGNDRQKKTSLASKYQ